MTSDNQSVGRRRPFAPSDIGQPLDHFVSGFEWTIPTRLELLDFKFQEQSPGELDASKMLWFSVAPPLARVHAGPGLLEDFLKLESASDQAILVYARRWGPLWLCPVHNLPWQHDPECEPSVSSWEPEVDEDDDDDEDDEDPELIDADLERISAEDTSKTWYDELLSGWRDLSRQARATIRLARLLHDGQLGNQADWDALPFLQGPLIRLVVPSIHDPFVRMLDFPAAEELETLDIDTPNSVASALDHPVEHGEAVEPDANERIRRKWAALGRSRMANSVELQRQLLGEVLNYWLELAGVRPRLDWSSPKPAVQLGGRGLIGALAVQLLLDCSRTDGLAVCTSCGTPFLPGPRRPRRDRNTYCSDCGIKAASRDAATRYRQTKKYRATYDTWLQKRRGSST
jgi:hypothetical protein